MLDVHDLPAVNAALNSLATVFLVAGYVLIKRRRLVAHRNAMIAIFTGALVVAGLFTLLPGRIMHAVVFGQ